MKVEPEFGELVRAVVGNDSYGQAAIKTEISKAYLVEMARGKVPSREVIEKFAAGYKANVSPLLIAAGYEQPTDTETRVQYALNGADDLSELSKQQLMEMVRDFAEKHRKDKD
ncbi:MAG: hypothetical protein ABFD54_14905 [Armatimonadota bacterium]|nr:hypothetical protein [bacterium]